MKSIIEQKDKEEFYIRLYFNPKKHNDNYYLAGIRRAFLDLSRTLKKENERSENIKKAENFLQNRLSELLVSNLNEREFDEFHKKACEDLKEVWKQLEIGQTQKWINMTLKYWLLLGENRIPGIEKNAEHFHIPIDRIIKEKIFGEKTGAWSGIKEYKDYFKYQKIIRDKYKGEIPIVVEFKEFNKS